MSDLMNTTASPAVDTTAAASPSIADVFDQLRIALFEAHDDDAASAAIDDMQAKFEARESALEARVNTIEQGLLKLAASVPSRKAPLAPADPIRPGAGTTVTSPVPVAELPQTDPSPATDSASVSNLLSVSEGGVAAADPLAAESASETIGS